MEKFGHVYIRRNTGNPSCELELLPSVRFSNLDHKWYDSDGNIHSEFEKHRGKNFKLSFQTSQYDKFGALVHFQGGFQVPYKLGEVSHQDFKGVEAAGKEDIKILRRFNLIPPDIAEHKTICFLEITAFLAAIHAGSKLSDVQMHRICNIALFIFDDDMEKLADVKFNSFHDFLKSVNSMMNKNKKAVARVIQSKDVVPNVLLNHQELLQFFEEELSIAECGTDRGRFVRETLMESLQGICVETCLEWNKERSVLLDSAQKELRRVGTGSIFSLEMVLFDAKIEVKWEIRNTFLFKWFLRRISYYIALHNDLVSYRKEVEAGRAGCNMVFLLHNQKGLALQEAMQRILDKTNLLSALIVETGEMLSRLYEDDVDLQRFVTKAKNVAYGCVQWHALTERYHKGFQYDCVLD